MLLFIRLKNVVMKMFHCVEALIVLCGLVVLRKMDLPDLPQCVTLDSDDGDSEDNGTPVHDQTFPMLSFDPDNE